MAKFTDYMTKKITALLLAGLFAFGSHAQMAIPVFTVFSKGDTVDKTWQFMSGELSKSASFQFQLQSPSAYAGRGIVLLQTSQARQFRFDVPSVIQTYGPEGIYISSNNQSAVIIANTALALKEAVYIYLEQLGFHYYLPGDIWKVVPKLNSPYKKLSILTKPDYEFREIANGHAFGNSAKLFKEFYDWAAANRLGGGFPVATGHAYEEIVMRNKDLFKKHPEYFALPVQAGTIPNEFKFNVGNKDLVDFIVKDAYFRHESQVSVGNNPIMISMEPSDGGGFGNKPECLAFGSPTDQVYYLTNTVAKALQKKYPGVWVGGYAYSDHILPTKYKLEPNVFVEITNGFNHTKYSTTDLIKLWKAKATKVGVYEYLSVYEWDYDMPGQVQAAKISYLKKSLNEYFKAGASVFQGESTMGTINRGPGQYILSKLTWNLKANTDSLLDDFYNTAFEQSAPYIKKLYSSWENYPRTVPADNDLAEWLSLVNDAYNAARTDAIRSRVDAIKKYLTYVVMYTDLRRNQTEENLMKILNMAYRSFEDPCFATLPALASLANYSGFKKIGWYQPDPQAWKNDKRPYTIQEVNENFQKALRTIKKTEGLTVVPAASGFVKLSDVTVIPKKEFASGLHGTWWKTEYIIQITKSSPENYFELQSDYSAQLPTERPVEVRVYPLKSNNTDEKAILSYDQRSKIVNEKFSLASLPLGTYRFVVDDQRKIFILKFSPSIFYAIKASVDSKIYTTTITGLNTFYFYVPAGVKKFLISKSNGFDLETPAGRKINLQSLGEETVTIDVNAGESGIWTISKQGGRIALEGIPPYLGDHPQNMLVPSYLKK